VKGLKGKQAERAWYSSD